MKERPILMSAPMVRAILDGRKSQTRRIVKPQPELDEDTGEWSWPSHKCKSMVEIRDMGGLGPYGTRGDRLWCRETHQFVQLPNERIVVYRATCDDDSFTYVDPVEGSIEQIKVHKWRPAIFMRRLESRILLEIESVRVERVQAITREDALAEGVIVGEPIDMLVNGEPGPVVYFDPVVAYAHLWCHINGADSWKANPWVWRVAFKRIVEAV